MFVRHQTIRRASRLIETDIFEKMVESEGMEDDVETVDEDVDLPIYPDHTVTIVVGKTTFMTYASTLLHFPRTTLTKMYLEQRDQQQNGGESSTASAPCTCRLEFDRDPRLFYYILDAYERKTVHVPRGVCVSQFRKEMEFWQLKHKLVAPCCRDAYMQAFGDIYQDGVLDQKLSLLSFNSRNTIADGSSCLSKLWEFLENPNLSKLAQWWSWLYYSMLIVSVMVTFFATDQHFRVANHPIHNGTNTTLAEKTPVTTMLLRSHPHSVITWMEAACAIFFTVVLILQTVSAQSVIQFCLSWRYLLELIYLTSVWTLLITGYVDEWFWAEPGRAFGFQVVQLFSVSRFMRLHLFDRSFDPFKILTLSVQSSVKEIYLLMLLMTVVAFGYGAMLYCTELLSATKFGDSFASTWCAIITMTTVGYGDLVPQTWLGRIVGVFCALSGILVIGMCLPLITSSFYEYFEYVFCYCGEKEEIKRKTHVKKLLRHSKYKFGR
ncbi:potassium voltage-gated channel protein Shaw-like [Gigantopelta aegis]|uniref:potassium voltage-gated channel protein Shaw-like n=1 Tax=Gigantopelta aegis TaxID=1735272 RepID=UPI001B88799F|nr:potassium voltage-gated channel protein Shaw-like [Gigantopelta aegis]XP_041349140.1 potassium voltage-gated channel protein Shaw-like [Gigantopelta aegis]